MIYIFISKGNTSICTIKQKKTKNKTHNYKSNGFQYNKHLVIRLSLIFQQNSKVTLTVNLHQ